MTAYSDIAKSLRLPTGAFIDGAFVDARSGATFETRNPYTGDLIALLPACGAPRMWISPSPLPGAVSRPVSGRGCTHRNVSACWVSWPICCWPISRNWP